MASVIATVKIMPTSPDVDIEALEKKAVSEITTFSGSDETKTAIEPIAFGLKALNITFVVDEAKGSPDPVAETIAKYEEVNSAEIVDVRRALG